MNRGVQFVEGLVLGAALSAGVVLLFAPQSGAQMRQMIRERVQEVVDEGRQAAEERQLELTAHFERLRQPTTQH